MTVLLVSVALISLWAIVTIRTPNQMQRRVDRILDEAAVRKLNRREESGG